MPAGHTSTRDRRTFVDTVRIRVRGGKGGSGAVSFRREPYVPRGGPDGGDGGRGGSVVLFADPSVISLSDYASRREWRAEDGRPGAGGRRSGRGGADLRLPVPPGTVVTDDQSGVVLGDLDVQGSDAVVAAGGDGGLGNPHFKSSVNQAPQVAEPGRPGQDRWLLLELKLIADVGLVGPPNAGKSSLLRAISAATPKVADYPFTTLSPELGVAELDGGRRLVVADIPGLIEGAARGAGLGHRFLRHVERTRVLVYVIDGAGPDPWAVLQTVQQEVRQYSQELARRSSLTVINKLDLPETRALRAQAGGRDALSPAGPRPLWCSALTGEGVPELIEAIGELVATAAPPARVEAPLLVRRLRPRRGPVAPPLVERHPWGFLVSGEGVERLVARTRFESEAALQRFHVALDRMGVTAALDEAGAEPGDTVRIAEMEFEYLP